MRAALHFRRISCTLFQCVIELHVGFAEPSRWTSQCFSFKSSLQKTSHFTDLGSRFRRCAIDVVQWGSEFGRPGTFFDGRSCRSWRRAVDALQRVADSEDMPLQWSFNEGPDLEDNSHSSTDDHRNSEDLSQTSCNKGPDSQDLLSSSVNNHRNSEDVSWTSCNEGRLVGGVGLDRQRICWDCHIERQGERWKRTCARMMSTGMKSDRKLLPFLFCSCSIPFKSVFYPMNRLANQCYMEKGLVLNMNKHEISLEIWRFGAFFVEKGKFYYLPIMNVYGSNLTNDTAKKIRPRCVIA